MSLPFPIVERKVWGLKTVCFVALVMCFSKGRPDWDVLPIMEEEEAKDWSVMLTIHQGFGSERSFLI
jgi:hypothetical protein